MSNRSVAPTRTRSRSGGEKPSQHDGNKGYDHQQLQRKGFRPINSARHYVLPRRELGLQHRVSPRKRPAEEPDPLCAANSYE